MKKLFVGLAFAVLLGGCAFRLEMGPAGGGGARPGYGGAGPAPTGQVVMQPPQGQPGGGTVVAPANPGQATRVEHKPTWDPNAYRCDAATEKPANPGNAWCSKAPPPTARN